MIYYRDDGYTAQQIFNHYFMIACRRDMEKEDFVDACSHSALWDPPEKRRTGTEARSLDDVNKIKLFAEMIWSAAGMSVKEMVDSTGLSQKKVSDLLCIKKRTLENWCTKKYSPTLAVQLWLLRSLKIIPDVSAFSDPMEAVDAYVSGIQRFQDRREDPFLSPYNLERVNYSATSYRASCFNHHCID